MQCSVIDKKFGDSGESRCEEMMKKCAHYIIGVDAR